MDNQTKITVAEIGSFKFNEDQDSNDNGIPDQLEIEKLRMSSKHNERKLSLEERKLKVQEEKNKKDAELKEKQIKSKNTK
jgi:hypothetical protein